VKIKVGSPELERDIERLTKVREAVGPNVNVMMDANQGMNLSSALKLADAVKPLRITWFEEPLHRRFGNPLRLRHRADTPTGLALRGLGGLRDDPGDNLPTQGGFLRPRPGASARPAKPF